MMGKLVGNMSKTNHGISTDKQIKALSVKGLYKVQGAKRLYISVSRSGSKNWIFRYTLAGKRPEIGLGGYPTVSLASARIEASKLNEMVQQGIDPKEEKLKKQSSLKTEREKREIESNLVTFSQVAREVYLIKRPEWKSERHAKLWWASLENHVFPSIGDRPIENITQNDVQAILSHIWISKPESAQRVQQRINNIFDYASIALYPNSTRTYFSSEKTNPARLAVLMLPNMGKARKKKKESFRSLAFDEAHLFVKALLTSQYHYRLALIFLMYTATRSGDVRGATWNEVDLENKIWTIPAERLKVSYNGDHRVPLSQPAIDILRAQSTQLEHPPTGNELIFPNTKGGQIHDDALNNIIRKLGYGKKTVVHGLRSTFATWAQEQGRYPVQAIERALAHGSVDDEAKPLKLGTTYQRSDLYKFRVLLMNDWASFLESPSENDQQNGPIDTSEKRYD